MIRIEGSSWRNGTEVVVQLMGLISKSGKVAIINGVFPHGVIEYEFEPDCLEVFIQEDRVQDCSISEELIPWRDNVRLFVSAEEFSRFGSVNVFLNGDLELELPILVNDPSAAKVISLPMKGCERRAGTQFNTV